MVGERSFVLAIDGERLGIHITDVAGLLAGMNDQKTKTHDFHSWTFLTKWLWDWLSCDVGLVSTCGDPKSVESLLEPYVVKERWESPWGRGASEESLAEYLPAKVWLAFLLNHTE